MKAKLNNQGLTLIELVIAITISTVILGAAFMFISGAERAYHKAESGINLQMEGQILMEQIGNWVMESNRIVVSHNGSVLFLFYIPLDNSNPVAYPYGYSRETKAKCRVLYSPKLDSEEKKTLYMMTVDDIDDAESAVKEALDNRGSTELYDFFSTKEADEYCIGDYVTDFSASVPAGEDADSLESINISLLMEQGKEAYRINDTFGMRNGLYNQFVTDEEDSWGGSGGAPAGDGSEEGSTEGSSEETPDGGGSDGGGSEGGPAEGSSEEGPDGGDS